MDMQSISEEFLWNSFNISFENKQNNKLLDKCCNKQNINVLDNEYVCSNCSAIISKYLDNTAEWRCFEEQHNNPIRCGMPTNDLLPETSLGTVIGGSCNNPSMWLVKKCHLWNNNNYKERTLYNIFDSIFIKANNCGIPLSIIEEAKALYKELSINKITRGNIKSGLIASALYMACKNNNVPRSAKEIANMFDIEISVMTKGCKKFQSIINKRFKSCNSSDFINRFCTKLKFSREIINECLNISKKIEELNLISGHTPPSIASCSIYLCIIKNDIDIDKKYLAEICGISPVTLLKCYKEIEQTFSLH